MKRKSLKPFSAIFGLLALAGTVSGLVAQEGPGFKGHWEGAIVVPGAPIEINVDFTVSDEGVWSGDISIPSQMAEDIPLAGVTVEGSKISFMMADVPGDPTFTGTLSEDGKTIAGPFTQSGAELEFQLTRKDP